MRRVNLLIAASTGVREVFSSLAVEQINAVEVLGKIAECERQLRGLTEDCVAFNSVTFEGGQTAKFEEPSYRSLSNDGMVAAVSNCQSRVLIPYFVPDLQPLTVDTESATADFKSACIRAVDFYDVKDKMTLDFGSIQSKDEKYVRVGELLGALKKFHSLGLGINVRNLDNGYFVRSDGAADFALWNINWGARATTQERQRDRLSVLVRAGLDVEGYGSMERGVADLHSDPVLAFEDASARGGTEFDYDFWIGLFAQPGSREAKLESYWHERYPDGFPKGNTEMIAKFYDVQQECLDRLSQVPETEPEDVTLLTGFTVNGDIEFAGPPMNGITAVGFKSVSNEYVIKLFKFQSVHFGDRIKTLCKEKAVLSALNGLGGTLPRSFEVFSSDIADQTLIDTAILQESAGQYSIINSYATMTPQQLLECIAKVILMFERLHDAGFTQGDFHLDNLLFTDPADPAGTLKLIDFGLSKTLFDREGRLIQWSGATNPKMNDLSSLHMIAQQIAQIIPDPALREKVGNVVTELGNELSQLGLFEAPQYKKWAQAFIAISKSA